jgi:hypothetical protein
MLEGWNVGWFGDESPGILGDDENTRGGGGKEEGNGDTVNKPWVGDYRIRYYLSSEKLKTVD